jgi:hypothetical protein
VQGGREGQAEYVKISICGVEALPIRRLGNNSLRSAGILSPLLGISDTTASRQQLSAPMSSFHLSCSAWHFVTWYAIFFPVDTPTLSVEILPKIKPSQLLCLFGEVEPPDPLKAWDDLSCKVILYLRGHTFHDGG